MKLKADVPLWQQCDGDGLVKLMLLLPLVSHK